MTVGSQAKASADDRGLAVAEILVATAVVGIGLGALLATVPASMAGVQAGDQVSTATFLAEQALERARAAAWASDPPVDCLGVSVGDAAPAPSGATCHGHRTSQLPDEIPHVAGHPGYQRTVRVTGCEAAPGCAGALADGLRRVEVLVRYLPAAGAGGGPAPRSVRLDGLVARR